jgi:hypothetical protein
MEERERVVVLDSELIERLARLMVLIPGKRETDLIGLGLKMLEQKVDRILRKRLAQKMRRLKKDGMSPKEIAQYLNEKGIPAAKSGQRWNHQTVTRWLGEATHQSW